jgi:pimeloyl-ACP methyl ester carboxylesterase
MRSNEARGIGYRLHGMGPYRIVLVHGGPGAPGSLFHLAEEIGKHHGALEPFQTLSSIPGLVNELHDTIVEHCARPVILLGHSWGAWLSVIFAAQYPDIVKSLLLVASGPFEDKYVPEIMRRRTARLSIEERKECFSILDMLEQDTSNRSSEEKDGALARLSGLVEKTDYYERIDVAENKGGLQKLSGEVYEAVWKEASDMRSSGALLRLACEIKSPVIAIHGKDDPHPYKGVRDVLKGKLDTFEFHFLARCGHYPWLEKHAKDKFYAIMSDAIRRFM